MKHTPGAVRSAQAIVAAISEIMPGSVLNTKKMVDKTATVIDSETAAPDLLAALKRLLLRYVSLVESGDAGNWDAEKEAEVIASRAAIAKAERDHHGP